MDGTQSHLRNSAGLVLGKVESCHVTKTLPKKNK